MDGSLGEFGIDLAIVVIISLVFSLVEGTFILPAHVAHSKALKEILIAGTVNYSNLQKIKFQKSKFIFVETNCFYI